MTKKGILLVNLGTPDSTKVGDVRRYLREFLSDERVIDIHPLGRFLLVNFIIAPFRAPKSAHEYQKLWTEKGSPLKYHSLQLVELLQKELGDDYVVELAMRYQNPSIQSALEALKKHPLESLLVIPLFPQYASATSGSVHQEVMRILSKWPLIPKTTFLDAFPTQPTMIRAFVENAEKFRTQHTYDHYLFTYHGLPERQLKKADAQCLTSTNCCHEFSARNRLCYRAQCYETSRKLAEAMGIEEKNYTVSFQSRLGKDPWIQPYTDETIEKLAKNGCKKLLVFSPSFVADCLETTIEIGEAYAELFREKGGERLDLVESLNTSATWVKALKEIVLENE
ncbi:MAG: ferrochelatase [Flammeovirgaceae bacterium]|nr:ferrochelatase [Flammeovirgaceae bacterium]MDW8288602.1 ferrochelatase [Flammeovirgaceae bacterium]